MKIAFFTATPIGHGGGTDKFFLEVTRGLKQKYPQMEITIITFDEIFRTRLSRLLSIYYITNLTSLNARDDLPHKTGPDFRSISYIECHSLTDLRKEFLNFDLIYSRNEIVDLILIVLATWNYVTPIITCILTPVHYPFTPSLQSKIHNQLYSSFLYRWLLSKAKAVHVFNEDDSVRLSKLFKKEIYLTGFPAKSENRIGKKNHTKKFHCLFIGRISEQKGVDILLKSIDLLSQDKYFKNFKFKIAGRGDPKLVSVIVEHARNYNNVQYLGHVPNNKTGKLYDWADVILIPSRYETGSYVAIEAAHRNRVVLASNIPGPRQIIDDGKTGFLLELDSLKFAEKIKELSNLKKYDPKSFSKFGKQAKLYMSEKLDPKLIFRKMYEMFQHIL